MILYTGVEGDRQSTMRVLQAFFIFCLASLPVSQANDAECDLCLTVVEAVEDFLDNGDTIDQILEQINVICESLGLFESLCKGFIEDKINEIINNIVEGNPPLGVCQNLGFCSDVTTTTPPPSKQFKTQSDS